MHRLASYLLLIATLTIAATPLHAQPAAGWSVATFLEQQPGPLKHVRVEGKTAAQIIEEQSNYYGV
ncbi:MAG: hypothetical protein J7464_16760, partial [Chloroflexus sp.]|nr:hypothetical protein [Chloroflexus sp.]